MTGESDEVLGEIDEATRAFIEDFAYAWGAAGNPRMDGRVLGLLLIVDRPYLSSAQIADLLRASTGAISMSTRALMNLGFVKHHSIPGDRSHYFRTEDDVWGSFLAGERDYLRRISSTIEFGLDTLPGEAERPRTRLNTARRYMTWLASYHRKMLLDWQAYRDAEDEPVDGDPEAEAADAGGRAAADGATS
jgi:DNA-binding transcriptional regulator GbsR (MarR family)